MRFRSVARRWLPLSVAVFSPLTGVLAQSGRALTIEDYYRVKTVAAPSLSPDARWVSFTVSTRIEENNGTLSEVWLVPSDASASARKVSGATSAVNPQWTDDGRLRFSSGGRTITIDPAAPDRADTNVIQSGAPANAGGRGNPAPQTWIASLRSQ